MVSALGVGSSTPTDFKLAMSAEFVTSAKVGSAGHEAENKKNGGILAPFSY